MGKPKSNSGSLKAIMALGSMPSSYEPQASEYEQDDDGFRESLGALKPNATLRAPGSIEYLQAPGNCPRRHKPKRSERVCSFCFAIIPPEGA